MVKGFKNYTIIGFQSLLLQCFQIFFSNTLLYTEVELQALYRCQRLLLTITLSLCKESIFAVLTLHFQDFYNSPRPAAVNAWSLSEFVGFCLSSCLLRIKCTFSMGLWSGEFPGYGPKMSIFCSPSHFVIAFALWQSAPWCWKRHCWSQTVLGWLGEVTLEDVLVQFFIHGCFFQQTCEWDHSCFHAWMVPGCFTFGMTQD